MGQSATGHCKLSFGARTRLMVGGGGMAPEQAFCAAIRHLALSPPQADVVEAGHKQGVDTGLLLLEPLYQLIVEKPDSLSIDRFANHLMQLTGNQARVSLGCYWRDQEKVHEALLVQHPSKKPMSLAKLLDILRGAGTNAWLVQAAGVEGQRMMHALKQPHLPMSDSAAAPLLTDLGTLPDRQAVIEQRIRARRASEPAGLGSAAPQAQQQGMLAQQQGMLAQQLASEGLEQCEEGSGIRNSRASARQAALFQDRQTTAEALQGNAALLASGKPEQPSAADHASDEPLSEQDSLHTASEGQDSANDLGQDHERPWDSACPEPFAWDGRSSLMVCVDPDKKTWYQAHVMKQKSNEYLLSWPAFPERSEEWLSKSSRRIWRQDQIKHEYWNQNAREFLLSGKRAWVLKACHWDWQMSPLSDRLPHKDPGASKPKPQPLRVRVLREEDVPQAHQSPTSTPTHQALFRGTCNGCWNMRSTLQSECGKCKVGACKACRDKWAQQRQHGRHANEAGLYVPQANVCFCGAHLTPRGAAAYGRKGKRTSESAVGSRATRRNSMH